ncbi:MAG TPA: DinB family protein, partial [Gemmatimonadales bacterium]|nr:DinB family protein [Gemmatimonadales bacterium]
MPLTPADRTALIDRYANGYAVLTAALAKVPKEAMQWRPGPHKWSAHEVIVHCADSESYAHVRLRILLAS